MKQTLPLIGSALLMAAMVLPATAQEQEEGKSSGPELKSSDVVTKTATVQDVDHAKRTVTLKGEDGKTMTLNIGKNVENFDQLKKGDQIKAAYYESAAISIRKAGESAPATGEKETVLAPEGEGKSGKAAIKTVQVAGTVEKVDPEKREVTLKSEEGKSKTMKVKEEVKDLDRLQKGDRVVVRYTEAFAIKVEPE